MTWVVNISGLSYTRSSRSKCYHSGLAPLLFGGERIVLPQPFTPQGDSATKRGVKSLQLCSYLPVLFGGESSVTSHCKGENSLQLETPESLLNDGQHHGRNVPLPWWEHVPGGTKIKDYFASTSLHGLKYFSEPSRLVERFYWIIAMVVVYVGLISSLYDQSKLFLNSPVLMSLDSSTTPVWDIPFPAVTICSENQVRPSFFNYSDYKTRTNMTKRELEVFEYLTMVCDYNATESGLNFFSTKALDEVHYVQ
ncbi:hypothetical protein J6590_023122 [Homalodisca vitripennis]|nr:hypothetical protein J6590_023122 [Homalodisca vitripennis]